MSTARDLAQLALSICLLFSVHQRVQSKDISGCCTRIRIASSGEAIKHQSNRVGDYSLSGVLSDRPIYKHEEREEFLFYLTSRNKGLWMVGPKAAQFNGGLAHRGDALCVEDVAKEEWKYTDGTTWNVDPQLSVSCLDAKSKAKCTYNDGVQFVGGDLPSEFGGGGIQTNMNSSAECIEECEKRTGCQYWTWVQEQGTNCFLKVDRVDSVRRPKYVSGSLPSACIQAEDDEEEDDQQDAGELSVCTHKGVDFVGGDLFQVAAASVDDCRQQCAEQASCQLFSYVADEATGCYLKTEAVRAKVSANVVSGAIASICEEFVLPHVSSEESSVYNPNQIDGKFKIMMEFREELNDPESKEFNELAGSLEKYLLDMLVNEPEFNEQATFDVRVESFRPGSVVCNFKVNYVLKEAYLAVPFAIKPSNITDSMNKNFKYKKGILFQRFLIAAGSFKSAAPVDHCQAKGCSHKCNYDYDIEDYVCTCPPALTLGPDAKTCLDPNEVPEEADTAEGEITTVQPEVVVALLPSDCLWSAWSQWSPCSCDTNLSTRSRSIAIPAKNGGTCSGTYEEEEECIPDAAVCAEASAEATTVAEDILKERTEVPVDESAADSTTQGYPEEDDTTEQVDDITTMEAEAVTDATEASGEADDTTEEEEDTTTEGSAEYDGEFGAKISPTTEESPVTSTEAIYDDDVDDEVESSGDYATTESAEGIDTTVNTLIEEVTDTYATEEPAVVGVTDEDADSTTVGSMDDGDSTTVGSMEDGENITDSDDITTVTYPEESDESDDTDSETATEMAQEDVDEEVEETTKLLINEDGTYDVVTVPSVELTTGASDADTTEMPASEDDETEESATNLPASEEDETEGSAIESDATEMPVSVDSETEGATETDATEIPSSEDDATDSATESVPSTNTEMATAEEDEEEEEAATTVASVESEDDLTTEDDSTYPSGRSDTTIFPMTEPAPVEDGSGSAEQSGETTVSPIDEESDDAMEATTQLPVETEPSVQCEGAACDSESIPVAGSADCGGYACDAGEATTEMPGAVQCEGSDCNTEVPSVDAKQAADCGNSDCQTEVAPKHSDCEGSQCDVEDVPTDTTNAPQCSEGSDCEIDKAEVDTDATAMEPELTTEGMDSDVDENDQMTTQEPSDVIDEEVMVRTEGTLGEENDVTESDEIGAEDTTSYPVGEDVTNEDESEMETTESVVETTKAAVDAESDDTDKETTPSPNVEYTESDVENEGTTSKADMNVDDSETTTSPSTEEEEEKEEMTETGFVGADMTTDQTKNTTPEIDQEIATDSAVDESVPDTSDDATTAAYSSEDTDDDSTTESAVSADNEERDDGPIVFPTDEDDNMFTTTLRSADSEIDDDSATEDAVDGVIDQVYVETTTTTEILEVTEPEKEDPEILSQTKDDDDASATTDTPRSFPDNTEIQTNAVDTAAVEEMTTSASADEEDSEEETTTTGDTELATESIDEATENIPVTTVADEDMVDEETTTVVIDESNETTGSYPSEDEVEARTESDSSDAPEVSPTMVTVVAVEESEDTTVVITTMRPEIDTDVEDVTTERPAAEEDTGLHEFECVEVDEGDLGTSAEQIPMECTQMDGEEKRKLYIVINKSQVDAEKLFAKNVKVVVKDFMVMDISNQSQVR